MRITDIAAESSDGRSGARAHVTWENCDREPIDLTVEAEIDEALASGAPGFLLAGYLPAWHAGEERVCVEGAACPLFLDSLKAASRTLQDWYPELGPPPRIESSEIAPVGTPTGEGSFGFLSCGVDSLAMVRRNSLLLSPDHPDSIRAVALVDFIREPGLTAEETARQMVKRRRAAEVLASDLGIASIPVRTNLLELDPDGNFFSYKWHGAVLAALAHLFDSRFRRACIASTYDTPYLAPWGSHPLLDPLYGSTRLRIDHTDQGWSRLAKTALVSEWPLGLDHLLVCQGDISGVTNCGACEKCIRTMTALAALGRLESAASFPLRKMTPALLVTLHEYDMLHTDAQVGYYAELVPALRGRGLSELANALDGVLRDYSARRREEEGRLQEVLASLPNEGEAAVADDDGYGRRLAGARCWGPPADGRTAARELEALRQSGIHLVVFRRPDQWWLEYYPEMQERLRTISRRVAGPHGAVGFMLLS